ncbi:hypothetical protein L596_030298 [Steinernema carpocapsae]|uniref:Uncharacterized protein n=1 Tax=Steinernema carpocapsae TaxID=34508 RepID=A0A4U5LNZ9_STECR|nr:hypothetical protein L596_030298 [Steinernema carpocapsae]
MLSVLINDERLMVRSKGVTTHSANYTSRHFSDFSLTYTCPRRRGDGCYGERPKRGSALSAKARAQSSPHRPPQGGPPLSSALLLLFSV